jgi:hypothetical protein
MRQTFASIALACSLIFAAPAFIMARAGHAEAPSPVTAHLAVDEGAQQREDRQAMARCIAKRHPIEVQSVIRSQDASLDVRGGKHVLNEVSCAKARFFRNSTFALNDIYYSYLAEYLLVSDYTSLTLPDIAHAAPLNHPAPPDVDPATLPPQYRDRFTIDRWRRSLDVISECVARAAPDKVFALAATKTDSQRETAVMDGLRDQLAICKASALSPAAPIFALRASLSENLYRLVDATRPVTHDR